MYFFMNLWFCKYEFGWLYFGWFQFMNKDQIFVILYILEILFFVFQVYMNNVFYLDVLIAKLCFYCMGFVWAASILFQEECSMGN